MGSRTLEVANLKQQWLSGNLWPTLSATVLGANRKPINLVWTPQGQLIHEWSQAMVSAAPKVDLVRDLYPFCPEWQQPWDQRKKKKMINRISQQPSTAERFQYGPGRNNPIILSCKRVTNTPKFYCFFHNHYTFLPLKCWDFSEHPGLLTILLEWEHRRKRIPFFLFWWWVNNRKKNQDTNSQFWCFPDLLEALISSTIRNTYIYKEG